MPIVTSVLIVTGIVLAGCSSTLPQSPSSSSGQQSVNQSTQQQSGSGSQKPPEANGQQRPPDNSNMTAVLTRAAEILGISSDEFMAAFQSAMPEGGPSGPGQQGEQPGAPPSGEQGQPPERPAGEQGQPPAAPDGERPSNFGPAGGFTTEVYEKMAAELGVSADDIAAAITQAQEELQQ